MNDDLVGIGGLLGCIVLLVLYALAIGAKTKQQPSKPLKPIQPPSTSKIVTPRAVNPTYERHLREVMEWAKKVLSVLIFRLDILIPISGRNTENGGTSTINCLPRCTPSITVFLPSEEN